MVNDMFFERFTMFKELINPVPKEPKRKTRVVSPEVVLINSRRHCAFSARKP
jgi:hypothetical protein